MSAVSDTISSIGHRFNHFIVGNQFLFKLSNGKVHGFPVKLTSSERTNAKIIHKGK